MAVDDIRLKFSFLTSRKRKRLRRIIGPASDTYLINLLLQVGQSRPTGDITGWTAFDIADVSEYPLDLDPDAWTKALTDCGFLDVCEDKTNIHNWDRHQGYVSGANRRSHIARMAAASRWGNKTVYEAMRRKLGLTSSNAISNATSNPTSNAPLPYPLPKDTTEKSTGHRIEKICDVCKTKTVDQPHHSKCRSCFGSQHAKHNTPTGRHHSYTKCPYCNREQSALTINHQNMNCNICEDETT